MIQEEDEDLEDGEIEDDDDEIIEQKPVFSMPATIENKSMIESAKNSSEKSPSSSQKKSSSSEVSKKSSSSKKDKGNQDEDEDFMSSIESQIASVLKKDGVEPPMPSLTKKTDDQFEDRKSSRSNKKRRKRKEKKDQKRDGATSKVY